MSSAAQWQAALAQPADGRRIRILFGRLGLVAQCRSLTAGEVAECAEMGGEAGARYALYLACDALRQAGDAMQKQGEILSPFDITQRIPYSDTAAAAALIFSLSGAGQADIRLLAEDEEEEQAIAAAQALRQAGGASSPTAATTIPSGESAAMPTPPVPVTPAAPVAVAAAAELFPHAGEKMADETEAAESFAKHTPGAPVLSAGLAQRALAGEAVWWEEDESAAEQTRRTATPAAARQTGGYDPDNFARVLADRLRDAAGNM